MDIRKQTNSKISVIDNFLPLETFKTIQEQIMGDNFPWYYSPWKTSHDANEGVFDSQFTHMFYFDEKWNSPHLWAVEPILSILDPKIIVRIKANLTVPSTIVKPWGMHVDFDNSMITTGILYLTDCDGGTVFEDGSRVESASNRFVYFPATTQHSGETFTNAKARCVINFNLVL